MSLSDRLAIVTGGGSGIGKEVCHALAREGAKVVVADINLDAARATTAELKGWACHCLESENLEENCMQPLHMQKNTVKNKIDFVGVFRLTSTNVLQYLFLNPSPQFKTPAPSNIVALRNLTMRTKCCCAQSVDRLLPKLIKM